MDDHDCDCNRAAAIRESALGEQVSALLARIAELEKSEAMRQTALHDSLDFARLALSAVSGVGVWTYEVASDCFYCDAAISEVYGLDAHLGAAGISRAGFLANVHPDDMVALRATMAGGLLRSGDLELEYRISHPDGSTRWVLSRGTTYFDDTGKPVRRTGIGVDMTRQRLIEQQLHQSQKMEAVGQLTSGIAHDFNNLLAGITSSLDLIAIRVNQGQTEQIARYVDLGKGAARRAGALTHRLLAFSRQQPLDPSATDVRQLVAGMAELISRTVGPAIELEVTAKHHLWPVLVDENQLENALLNLCINARDAMPEGGGIAIDITDRTLDAASATAIDAPPGDYVCLSVADTGTGMSAETVDKAFDPFFTTKPAGQGTGLGLSMLYGFVRQSEGRVVIDSELGRGTAIRIYLPRHERRSATGSVVERAARAVLGGNGETVLVVDDEPTVRMLVSEVLEDLGYIAIEADEGVQALAILASDTRVDLLVADLGLRGSIDGQKIAERGRIARPDLKVLFITGYADKRLTGDAACDPGSLILNKPFGADELAASVNRLLQSD